MLFLSPTNSASMGSVLRPCLGVAGSGKIVGRNLGRNSDVAAQSSIQANRVALYPGPESIRGVTKAASACIPGNRRPRPGLKRKGHARKGKFHARTSDSGPQGAVQADVRTRALSASSPTQYTVGSSMPLLDSRQVVQRSVVGVLAGEAVRRSYPSQSCKILFKHNCRLRGSHPMTQGLITVIPIPSKSSTSLVATDASRLRAMAAIWQSAWFMGRPAARRVAAIKA